MTPIIPVQYLHLVFVFGLHRGICELVSDKVNPQPTFFPSVYFSIVPLRSLQAIHLWIT